MPKNSKMTIRLAPAGQAKKSKQRQKKSQEVTRLGSALRALGGMGGAAIGGLFGQPLAGSGLGTGLGATLSKWLGSGDYKISQNSIVRGAMNGSDSIPAMHNTGQSITVRHKEFLTEVRGSMAFSVQRFFLLQPGDKNTFPWLSGIAGQFQQYRIKGMVFHYVPTSGYAVSGANPAIGSVMIQTSYRANDSDPASKVELLNEYWASESAPSQAFCHPIECAPSENPFSIHYVRNQPVPTSDSPLMYDMGKTFVATSGMPGDNNVVGDLWVTYEIELSKPVVVSSITSPLDAFQLAAVAPVNTNWFGGAQTFGGRLGITANVNTITFPHGSVGSYNVSVRIVATTTFTAVDLSGISTVTNCTLVAPDLAGVSYNRTVLGGTAPTTGNAYYNTAVIITDPGVKPTIQFPNGVFTGGAAVVYVTITQFA